MSFNFYYSHSHHFTPAYGKGDFRCGSGMKAPLGALITSGGAGPGAVGAGGGACSGAGSGVANTTTLGNALDDMMCGKMDGNLSSGSSNVSPNSVFYSSSILLRDLILSEDSDADQLSEDNKTSANQSKQGKVMESASHPTGKRTPRVSSSSSGSSDSSSDSAGEGDEDDTKEETTTTISGKAVANCEEEKAGKGTSSTSNSSSDSSSGSSSEGEDEEGRSYQEAKKEKMDAKTALERGEKTPSPQAKQTASAPSSTPDPAIQETGENNMVWNLGNFLNPSKKSLSPESASPFKSPSPAASNSHRDETGSLSGKQSAKESGKAEEDRPGSAIDSKPVRSLKEIGHTTTMPFDLAYSEDEDITDGLRDNKNLEVGNSDGDDEEDGGGSHTKLLSPQKKKKSPTKESKHRVAAEPSKAGDSSSIGGKTSKEEDSWKQSEIKRKPSPSLKAKGQKGKPTPSPNKKRRPKSISHTSSEEDEIDVVNFTPDEKGQQRSLGAANKGISKKRKEEVTKTLFRNHSPDSEGEESSRPASVSDRHSPTGHKKVDWHKSRPHEPISPLSSPHDHVSPSQSLPITPRKLASDNSMAFNHLESICKPLNLLSPLHSGCSPSPSSSTKPLPSFHKSFSPAPQSAVASGSPAPIVTVSNNGKPQIVVRIRLNAVSEKRLNRLKDRKSRKSSVAGKLSSSGDAENATAAAVAPSSESRLEPDAASRGHRVPPIGGVATSYPMESRDSAAEGGSSGSSRRTSSSSSHTTPGSSSKPPKRKLIDPGGDGHPPPSSSSSSLSSSSSSVLSSASHSPSVSSSSNPFHKLPKSSKIPSKEVPPLPPPVSSSSSSSSMRSSSPSLSSNVSHTTSGSLLPSEAASDESSAMSSLKKSNSHPHHQHHHHQHHSSNSKKTPPYSDAGSSSGQKRTSSSGSSNSYSISGSGGGGASSGAKNSGDLGSADNANKADAGARSERPAFKDSTSSKGPTHSESKNLKRRSGEAPSSTHEEESSSSSSKRVKSEPIHAVSSSKPEVDKTNNGHAASTPDAAPGTHRRDSNASSSSRSSHKSSSKKSRRPSATTSNNNNNNNNSDKNSIDPKVNHPDAANLNNRDLPFNHYVNGTSLTSSSSASNSNNSSSNNSNAAAACGYSNSRGPSMANLPPHLPVPSPIETQLKTMDQYMCRAKEHKHRGDGSDDHMEKIECYLRGCLNFFLAGYTMEQNRNGGYRLYEETFSLLQFAIRRAGDTSDSHSSERDRERERKFIVLMTRLQALLNLRMYRLRKGELEKFKKIIDSEQARPTPPAPVPLPGNTSSSKPHAPSPHQSSWNKNSTGTPSPMSPTPSPGSVSSQGSCELMTGKIPNGTAGGGTSSSSVSMINSPSPCMVTIPQRLHTIMHKYINHIDTLVKATDLWDQAAADSRGLEEFFLILDNACGPLSIVSEPLFVVRYMKYALRLLCDAS